MSSFDIVHQDRVVGNLCMFDRMIFKGHLTRLYPPAAFGAFLTRQGVLFKDFKPYVQAQTATLKAHAQRLAADAGRPYVWLQSSTTRRQGRSKEDLARDIAARDGVVEGAGVRAGRVGAGHDVHGAGQPHDPPVGGRPQKHPVHAFLLLLHRSRVRVVPRQAAKLVAVADPDLDQRACAPRGAI